MHTEPPKADPPKRKRRWFQFSLRTLILSTAVLGATGGWLGKRIEQKRLEREAVSAIVKLGGLAVYDYEKESAKSPGPDWVRRLLGENFFSDVVEVNFAGVPVGNGDLACLDDLVGITNLDLRSTEITDDGLASLIKLQKLESLDVSSTRVTYAGFLHIAQLKNLKRLSARDEATTYAGNHPRSSLAYYFGTVDLAGNQMIITGQPSGALVPGGIPHTAHDQDGDHQPRIGDASLAHLKQLQYLESLDLEGTDVTSQGISKLNGLSKLTHLCVRGTNVSEAAIAELKRALPRLKVDKYFPPMPDTGLRTSTELGDQPLFSQPINDALIDFGK